ncbi:MAG: hypothetical protein HOP23_01635 [Methylococcaceae bacterium]|nr:hypothetical protein [Methylococcaceae bacterium]
MPKKSESALLLTLKPSTRLMRGQVLLHLLACITSFANSLQLPIKMGLLIAICLHVCWIIRRLSRQHYQFRYTEHSNWEVLFIKTFEPVDILKSSLTSIFVIILNIKSQHIDDLTILIASDTLCEDDYRQLIVKLRTTAIKNKREYDGYTPQ